MFWGLIMEPKRRYTQTVKKPFHITKACLDLNTDSDSPTQVLYSHENRNYLLCTLQKNLYQCDLNLFFDVNDKVTFVSNGAGHVHLTGFVENDELSDFESMDTDEEEVEEEEETENETTVNKSSSESNKKRKAAKAKENAAKKLKPADLLNSTLSEEEDDDPDFNFDSEEDDGEGGSEEQEQPNSLLNLEDSDDEEEDEEEESEEDDDDDENEEDEELSDEDNENVFEMEKPTMNGTVQKKNKKLPDKNIKQMENDAQQNKKQQQKQQQSSEKKKPSKQTPQKRTIEGGVTIEDLRVGNGPVAKSGRVVQVYYEGRLQKNSKMFDSLSKGPGFKFRLGKQEVIKGWDIGVAGMKVGGKRRITCPPAMAYGQSGSAPKIPPNSTLVFEVELKNVS